jgi:hypothetical protein
MCLEYLKAFFSFKNKKIMEIKESCGVQQINGNNNTTNNNVVIGNIEKPRDKKKELIFKNCSENKYSKIRIDDNIVNECIIKVCEINPTGKHNYTVFTFEVDSELVSNNKIFFCDGTFNEVLQKKEKTLSFLDTYRCDKFRNEKHNIECILNNKCFSECNGFNEQYFKCPKDKYLITYDDEILTLEGIFSYPLYCKVHNMYHNTTEGKKLTIKLNKNDINDIENLELYEKSKN